MGDASANGTPPADARGTAQFCLDRGYTPVPIPHLLKGPRLSDWEQLHHPPADLDAHFPAGKRMNVGVLNGEPSGGLVDLDLDCPEARRAAPLLVPDTGMVSDRASAPDSHYWYVVGDPPRKAKHDFDDPTDGRHLMEFRSTGGQTVLPRASTRPSRTRDTPAPSRASGTAGGCPPGSPPPATRSRSGSG